MEKNKRTRRIFSRVLCRLAWATFYHVNDENGYAYNEVLAAKRCIEDFGGEDVKVAFDREYYITFELYRVGHECNRYYTASASHGYVNGYHWTNHEDINALIDRAAYTLDCTLRRDYHDYLTFQQRVGNVLYWALSQQENHDYWNNGDIHDIPYDVSIRLWRDLRECVIRVVDESIVHKKVVI